VKLLECSQALKAAAPIARDAPRGDGPTTPSEGPDVLHTLRKNGALAYSNGAPVALFSALNSEVDVLSRKQQRHFGCVRHISLCLDWCHTVELETEHRSPPLSAPLRVDVRNRGVWRRGQKLYPSKFVFCIPDETIVDCYLGLPKNEHFARQNTFQTTDTLCKPDYPRHSPGGPWAETCGMRQRERPRQGAF
jgi:hypothetical protein